MRQRWGTKARVEARSALNYGLMVASGIETGIADDVREGLVELRSQLGKAASTLANAILARGGTPDPGMHPLVATNYNFLAIDALLTRLEPTVPGDAATLDELASALPEPLPQARIFRSFSNAWLHSSLAS